jgi:hypothetical protein
MDEILKNELGEKLRWHAVGPIRSALEFKRFVSNGTLFRTRDNDLGKTTQNSGVSVLAERGPTYYSLLTHMFELQYYDESRYVLFKCDWANITPNREYKMDEYGFVLVNFTHLIHTGERISDDPFILSSQASQVYYVVDERNPDWVVVVMTKLRDVYDFGEGQANEDDVLLCFISQFSTLHILFIIWVILITSFLNYAGIKWRQGFINV